MLLNWVDHAKCAGYDPELWFQRAERNARFARSICYECPVMLECRVYGLSVRLESTQDSLYGVWGGLTKAERRRKPIAQERLDEALETLWRKNQLKPSMMS